MGMALDDEEDDARQGRGQKENGAFCVFFAFLLCVALRGCRTRWRGAGAKRAARTKREDREGRKGRASERGVGQERERE